MVVSLLGSEIRCFYESLRGFESSRLVLHSLALSQEEESHLKNSRAHYLLHPEEFVDERLVELGSDYQTANQNPVRIEVRRTPGMPGAAQIAARGIPDPYRDAVILRIHAMEEFQHRPLQIKKSGQMSLEVNVRGVDKALPIRYLITHWEQILQKIDYQRTEVFDARPFRTWIATDGDGTLYAKPKMDRLPLFQESPALGSVIDYLSKGGIFLLISGNGLDRTLLRVKDALPLRVRCQFLISANGGADLGYFNSRGDFQHFPDYVPLALVEIENSSFGSHDGIYLGDDGALEGNDFSAFHYIGPERSFLVGAKAEASMAHLVGGFEFGTARILKAVSERIGTQAGPVFSSDNLNFFIRQGRGGE